MTDRTAGEPTILIIRRGGGSEIEKPHGGVWKIAYADFMTAMMAFFLVMWLINATDESTRTGVANYFNPIKMSEGTRLPKKGLVEPEQAEPGASDPAGKETPGPIPDPEDQARTQGEAKTEPPRETTARHSGEALFRDPYAVLAAIGAEAGEAPGIDTGADDPISTPGGTGEPDRADTEPPGDPFDPPTRIGGADPEVRASMHPGGAADGPANATLPRRAAEQALPPLTPAPGAERDARIGDALAAGEPARAADSAISRPGDSAIGGASEIDASASRQRAIRLLERLTEDAATHAMPNVTVSSGDDGLLISLSDQVDFGMFAIGSAEPLPETVAVMAKIAEILKELPGQVVIRGHTDARPFRSGNYDNWRLSAERAHMAYGMLVRGGLDMARVMRLEAHADRDLKVPDDPEAAENRRIEILVREVPS